MLVPQARAKNLFLSKSKSRKRESSIWSIAETSKENSAFTTSNYRTNYVKSETDNYKS